jgi:hypothetical protein
VNRTVCVVFVLFLLSVFAVSSMIVRGASQVQLTPSSSQPAHSVHVEGSDFAASKTAGIGFGAESKVNHESFTVIDTGIGTNPRTISGYSSKAPIKPGSFRWYLTYGGFDSSFVDNGDGTLSSSGGLLSLSTSINYTSGFFSRTFTSGTNYDFTDQSLSYTTYEFDATPEGFATDGSGVLSGNFTVPDIWNGTHTATVIDEAGNIATSEFTVFGSDFIPEALTVGAVVLLTSTAIVFSFYWLRKKPAKMVKYS